MSHQPELSSDHRRRSHADSSYALLGEEVEIPGFGKVTKSETAKPPPGSLFAGFGCSEPGCTFMANSSEPREARPEYAEHRRAQHVGVDTRSARMVYLYRPDPDHIPPEQPSGPRQSGPHLRRAL